ncbi:MAG: DUF1573 domain-containing protein [Bacteroidota bacterium]
MKKIVFLISAALIVLGMVACQQSESADNTDKAGEVTVNETPKPAAAPAAPAAPKKPSYIEKAEAMEASSVEFASTEHDFGTVTDGDLVRHTFEFTNTGAAPIVIQRAKPSCGCTTPNWTKEPIQPGEKGVIEVEFNTKNKPGMQTKTVTVTGNFADQINKVLKIKGEVKKAG